MAKVREKLFNEFPPVSMEEWKEKAIVDLKGAPYDKRMLWKTPEGFVLDPIYNRESIKDIKNINSLPGEYPYLRGSRLDNNWLVRQDIDVVDPVEANKKALDILFKGVTSLGFKFKSHAINAETIAQLFNGIDITAVEVNLIGSINDTVELTQLFVNFANDNGINPAKVRGSIAYNPYKRELVKGTLSEDAVEIMANMLSIAKDFPHLHLFHVDAYLLNNAGSKITQELGYALSWGQSILQEMLNAGHALTDIVSRIKFNFGVSTSYFLEIAKFRAARTLWAYIVGAYGEEYKGEDAKIHMHAITSVWNMTVYDPYVNLLRSQTETMSASIAGVDSITVVPFNVTYEEATPFSERLARNQQLLLAEESHFDKVVDASGGSYYIETLTQTVADAAWNLFLEVDEAGGFHELVRKGDIQKEVNASNQNRHKLIAQRRLTLLGTNEFPNFTEEINDKIQKVASSNLTNCGCASPNATIESLDFSRGASEFEQMRLSTERDHQPLVFMLTIGNLAMRLARSQFAGNFFGCAGYKLKDNLGFKTVEEGINAAMEAKADIVVLCSSDDEYATYAPEAFKLLDGRAQFVVAGNPKCTEELQAQGIEHFIHVKSNVLETLQQFNKTLNINETQLV